MNLLTAENKLKQKRILVTGHTGFTGSWVRIWLESIGIEFYGLSFDNLDEISLQKQLNSRIKNEFIGDVADSNFVFKVFSEVKPDYVLHLAAQPIVSIGYLEPFRTITSNTLGTAVVLEACKRTDSVRKIVCVTTDKVYKNLDLGQKFIESDELKGGDPYSLSKSAAENIIEAYYQVFAKSNRNITLHVARGGNIVGGGDYSQDRIIPDLVRSIIDDKPILIRQPNSSRPWQHVLSLVHGYILLLAEETSGSKSTYQCWNFGPFSDANLTVADIISFFNLRWQTPRLQFTESNFKESSTLSIDSNKAFTELNWDVKWGVNKIFSNTIDWYKLVHTNQKTAKEISELQLADYRILHSN
jgi:CDP-glucose 4,6-dehydratase